MYSKFSRRAFIAGSAAATLLPASGLRAAGWPERTITLVHGFGVGGNADVISRIVAERLSTRLGSKGQSEVWRKRSARSSQPKKRT